MHTITVSIDSREQDPLPFPAHVKVHLRRSKTPTLIKVKTVVERMDAGDYALKGFERECIGETKRSARELYENLCGPDFKRANNAFQRLSAATKCPFLICEFGQGDLRKDDEHFPQVADALGWAVAHYGLSLWFCGPRSGRDARRLTGELVLRMMLARVELAYPNFLHGVPDAKVQSPLDPPPNGGDDSRSKQSRRRALGCGRAGKARQSRARTVR